MHARKLHSRKKILYRDLNPGQYFESDSMLTVELQRHDTERGSKHTFFLGNQTCKQNMIPH